MIIGKWNKSVIATYLGLAISVVGLALAFVSEIKYAMSCLMIAGICDLFDGKIARSCKRTKEEELFGVELDSMADVANFVVVPIGIFLGTGRINPAWLILYVFFAICGVARLSYFNMSAKKNEYKIEYYQGLPVTYTALILPITYLFDLCFSDSLIRLVFPFSLWMIGVLNVLDINIAKPRGKAYGIFSMMAVGMLLLYMVIL